MENVVFNKCQTPLEDLHLEDYPQEVQDDNQKTYTVYRHINPKNGKVYVGITKLSLSERWEGGSGYKRCKLFYRAIQKYGWSNLQHCVVCSCLDKTTACLVEQHLIKYYKSKGLSYNITDGGEGTHGFKMPESAKRRISEYLKENRGKPVFQFSIDGHLIRKFKSAQEAAQILGFGHSSVSDCATGNKNTLHNFIFTYEDNVEFLPLRISISKKKWSNFKVVQYKNDSIINVFNSIREAERATGINRLCIARNISGEFKRAGDYNWKKVKEEELHGNEV